MKTLDLTEGMIFELHVLTNCKPADIPALDITSLEALIALRKTLPKAGKMLAKVIEIEASLVDENKFLNDVKNKIIEADPEKVEVVIKKVNKANADKDKFYFKHKEDPVKLEVENDALEAIRAVFEVLGKQAYSHHAWGTLESYVNMNKALNNPK